MLIAQPRRSHLGKQKDVERELGLADLAHSTYFSSLTRGRHSEKRYKNASTELAAAGVYRVLGSETPRRVWWLAFSGKWGSLPRFNARECFHSFTAEEDGAGKKTIAVPLTAGKGGDEGGRASGVPRREGHCATGTATRASVVGMDQDSPKMLQRLVPSLLSRLW